MMSIRSKMVVRELLDQLGLQYGNIEFGEVELKESITEEQRTKLSYALLNEELELLEDNKCILVEKIKNIIVEMIHYKYELSIKKYSTYLSEKLNHSYQYLANIFSEVTGSSIEQYIIAHKIEKAKTLLAHCGLTLTEIAWKLNYSSVAHLSNQFKKVTGIKPSLYKKLEEKKLVPLEYVGMKRFHTSLN